MWRSLLPASYATIVAVLSSPYAAAAPAPGQSPSAPSVAEQQEKRQAMKSEAVNLQRQISDLQGLAESVKQRLTQRTGQKPPAGVVSGQQAMPGGPEQQALLYSQQQDRELHSQLEDLLPQLKRELQLDEQSTPPSDIAEQQRWQSSLDAFKDVVAHLQGEDSQLQALIAQGQEEPKQRDLESSPGPKLVEQQPARDAVGHQADEPRDQLPDSQRLDNATGQEAARDALEHQAANLRSHVADLQQQLATQKQDLARTTQELAQRAHELDEARGEADKLRQEIDRLGEQRQAEEALLALQRAQEQMGAALPPHPVATVPSSRRAQPLPARQPTDSTASQPMPSPPPSKTIPPQQPAQLMPAQSEAQQLQTARQWLSAGRPDEARRILAMVQTQMVFQPVTPDQPSAQGGNSSATDIGDAIRWLDMGASGQAMQSITRAIGNANPPTNSNFTSTTRSSDGPVRAWSGYTAGTP
jgi:hypothetical protein